MLDLLITITDALIALGASWTSLDVGASIGLDG